MTMFLKVSSAIALSIILVGCRNNPIKIENKATTQTITINQEKEDDFIKNCDEKLTSEEKFFLKYWWTMTRKEFDYVTELLLTEGLLKTQDSKDNISFVFYVESQKNQSERLGINNSATNDTILSILKPNFKNDSLISLTLDNRPDIIRTSVKNSYYEGSRNVTYLTFPFKDKLFELYMQKYGDSMKSKTYDYLCLDLEKPYNTIPYKVHSGFEYKWHTNYGYIIINSVMTSVTPAMVIDPMFPLFNENDDPKKLSIEYLSLTGYQLHNSEIQEKEEKLRKILSEIENNKELKKQLTKKSI